MKYTYAYRTSDGARHEASMDASSRDEVFAALRREGIRPIKVVAADGSKANGELHGVGKRAVAALLAVSAAVAALIGVVAYLGGEHSGAEQQADAERATPRHQIYGDPAILEAFERGDFGKVLVREGDRLLAWFAQPGKTMCPKGVSTQHPDAARDAVFAAYAADELDAERDLALADDEPREVRELKQIVNGMRGEMRAYLANGNGTPRSYWRRLNERTAEERRIFERTRRELKSEASPDAWEQKNSSLRRIGLRTIPMPEDEA